MQQFKRFVFAIFVIGLLFNFQTVNAQQDSIKTIDESTTPENETAEAVITTPETEAPRGGYQGRNH